MSTNTSTSDGSAQGQTTTTEATLLDESIYNQSSGTTGAHSGTTEIDSVGKFNGADLETLFISPEAIIEQTHQPWKDAREEISDATGVPQWNASINVDTLDLFIRHIQGSIRETRLFVTEEGLYTRVTNPANIQMFEVWIGKEDFEDYHVEAEGVLGIDWSNNVKTMINQVDSGDTVDIGTLIDLKGSVAPDLEFEFGPEFQAPNGVDLSTLEMNASKISSKLDHSNRAKFEIDDGFVMRTKTIDPDSIRAIPEIPEMDHTSRITLPGTDIKEFLSRADNIARYFGFESSPEQGVTFSAEGDTASVEKEFKSVEDLIEYVDGGKNGGLELSTFAQKTDESRYSIEFVKDVLGGIRKTQLRESYRIDFGDEQPLKMKRALGDESFIQVIVAPRISK